MLLTQVTPSKCFFVSFKYKIVSLDNRFSKFLKLFINILVSLCQLPHPAMARLIDVSKS